jgi:hypothetical protein
MVPDRMYEIVAWTALGVGALLAAYNLVSRTSARTRSDPKDQDALGRAVRSGVFLIAIGLAMLGVAASNSGIEWGARLLLAAALLSVLMQWLRAKAVRRR